jgi:hypothetical protein
MISLTATAQLSSFNTIKTVLKSSSVLSAKFQDTMYYEFEPRIKGPGFKGFPYIVINTPTNSEPDSSMDRSWRLKPFSAVIELVMDYEARANVVTYANAIINAIETGTTTFESAGIYGVECTLNGIDDQEIRDMKPVVRVTFDMTWTGQVAR